MTKEKQDAYYIDVKDQFGWVTYSYHADLAAAKAEALALRESFIEIVLIDRSNAIAISFEKVDK